jgi:hypothetical protein
VAAFDPETLALLDREREVDVVTTRPDGSPLRVTTWVVVADGDVFLRSWRGDRGHWYQAALDRPDEVELVAGGSRLQVRVVPATDAQSVARCSSALEAKYAGDPATPGMVRSEVLGTTLRVEPR